MIIILIFKIVLGPMSGTENQTRRTESPEPIKALHKHIKITYHELKSVVQSSSFNKRDDFVWRHIIKYVC